MYIMNGAIEAIDDQNEHIAIEDTSGSSLMDIDPNSGTVTLYTNITSNSKVINNTNKTFYSINRTPCTIYRNLKKITIKRGRSVSWKYLRFRKD